MMKIRLLTGHLSALCGALLGAVAALHGGADRAAGQSCGGWIAGAGRAVPGVVGTIYDMVVWDPDGPGPQDERLVVCGSFTIAGDQEAKFVALWDGIAWSTLGHLPGFGSARALAQHDGHLFIGGMFSDNGSEVRSNLLWWDGSEWRPVVPGPIGAIRAMRSFHGALVVAGEFTQIAASAGIQSGRVARWTGSAWEAMGDGLDGTVECLEEFGPDLIAGGSFSASGGTAVTSVARWNGTTWSAMGGGMSGTWASNPVRSVHSLHALNGSLYAAGTFGSAGGVSAAGFARWDGSAWSAGYPTSLGGRVYHVGSFGGRLFVSTDTDGSHFVDAGGTTKFMQASVPYASLEWRGSLYLAGSISRARGATETWGLDGIGAYGIARWDGLAWHSLGHGMDSSIAAMGTYRGEVIAGGLFTSIGAADARSIARWDGAGWRALGEGFDNEVTCLAEHNDRLYAGGRFSRSGSLITPGIAEWDGTAWHAVGSGITDGRVTAMCSYQGQLVVAVDRELTIGQHEYRIAAWNGLAFQPMVSFTPGTIHWMRTHDESLVLAGGFASVAGTPARNIALWDGEAWSPLGNGPGGEVFGMCIYRGRIHVARAGRGCIYAWDEQGGTWITVDCSLSAVPEVLGVYHGMLIAGGAFHNATTIVTDGLAAWDGRAWRNLGLPPQRQGGTGIWPLIYGLATADDELFVGGNFDHIGGIPYPSWGRWKGIAADLDDGSGTGRCDGGVGIEDLLYYLSLYEAADVRADVSDGAGLGDPDGAVDVGDLMWYLGRFGRGE